MGDEGSNTTPKQPGGATGKGFVKGDPRINRKGRPRTFDAAQSLARAIATEVATDRTGAEPQPVVVDGHIATVVEMLLRSWAASKDVRKQVAFMEYAYGKVPNPVQVTGLAGGPVELKVIYENRRQSSDPDDPPA